MQNQIKEFNKSLVIDNSEINILDNVKKLNDMVCNIDISFIDDFIDLVGNEGCCIHHELSIKYEITTLTSGSNDVKKIIEQNDGQERSDYELRQLADRIIYLLNPTF